MRKPLSILALLALLCSALAPAALGATVPMDMLCCKRAVRTMQHCHGMAMEMADSSSMVSSDGTTVGRGAMDCSCCRPEAQIVPAVLSRPATAFAPRDPHPFLTEFYPPEPQAPEQLSSSERGPPASIR